MTEHGIETVLTGLAPLRHHALPHREVEPFSPISLSEMDGVSLLNRVDTKYLVPRVELSQLLTQLQNGYRIFSHLEQRIHGYRTLYFDTPDNAMYLRHHNGFATRLKVRKRWYLGADLGYFEVKRRTNRRRTVKKRMRLSAAHNQTVLGSAAAIDSQAAIGSQSVINSQTDQEIAWLTAHCPYDVASLIPQTWTHFERITLVDFALQERVTIDHHLQFCRATSAQFTENLTWQSPSREFCIVEVKRGGARNRSAVMEALRARHILPASFSKYCIGTALLQPQLKHNRFKPILRSLGGLHV